MMDDGLNHKPCHQPAVGQLVLILECRDQTVQRKTIAKRRDHLAEGGWILLALAAEHVLLWERQSALATGAAQPRQIIQAGGADAFRDPGSIAQAQQTPVDLVKR